MRGLRNGRSDDGPSTTGDKDQSLRLERGERAVGGADRDGVGALLAELDLATFDAVIDPMLGYFRAHPSCVELWFARRSDALDVLVRSFDEMTTSSPLHVSPPPSFIEALSMRRRCDVGNSSHAIAFSVSHWRANRPLQLSVIDCLLSATEKPRAAAPNGSSCVDGLMLVM